MTTYIELRLAAPIDGHRVLQGRFPARDGGVVVEHGGKTWLIPWHNIAAAQIEISDESKRDRAAR